MPDPDVTAIVALLPSDQGGRAGPTPADWFGCVLTAAGRNFDVRLQLGTPLRPGEVRRVAITFLDPAAALSALGPGTPFGLWEGGEIGLGRIEQVRTAGPLAAE
jgi:hypothetical protein